MKFHYEVLDEVLENDETTDIDGVPVRKVITTFVSRGRWALTYRLVFEKADKFFAVYYRKAATEYQDEDGFTADRNGMVECQEVFPKMVEVVVYE